MTSSRADAIPTSVIGLLSQIIPDYYSHAEIDSLFLCSGAPEPIPDGNKQVKVRLWLQQINLMSAEPLKALGVILDGLFERTTPKATSLFARRSAHDEKLEAVQKRVREALEREGLTYYRGGNILKGGAVATQSLDESVKKHGLTSVDIEIQRALAQMEQDPHAAAQYAGNVLEAALKAYLDHKGKAYGNGDTLAPLWKAAAEQIGLRPEDWDNKDLKKIALGLNSIVDGIAHLRNTKSGAHGRSEEQRQNISIKPRHARLAIHSAHTVAAYVLELIEYPPTT